MTETNAVELLDKLSIQEVLYRYCRGLDRMDKAMAYSVWHDEGTADYYGVFKGSGHEFIDWVWEAHSALERHFHQVTNVITEIQGDSAISEAYINVALWTLPDAQGAQSEVIGRGRYLDRWSKRNGQWAIDHRIYVMDMQTINPLNRGQVAAESTRNNLDPSFAFFPTASEI